jgi:hypothetical protein
MYFAFDHHDTDTLTTSLRQQLGAPPTKVLATQATHFLALVDGAFDHGRQGLKWPRAINPLYQEAGPLAGLRGASPYLLALSEPSSADFASEIRRLSRHCNGRPMLSFLHCEVGADAVVELWQKYLMLKTANDDAPYLLRLADTRILPALATLPTPALWVALTSTTLQWLYIHRDGTLNALSLSRPERAPVSVAPSHAENKKIELRDKDLQHLLHWGQADSVINAIAEHFTDLLPTQHHATFYRHITQACALAEMHHLEAFPDILALSVASHLTQGQLLDDERLLVLLQDRQWVNGQLNEQLTPLLPEETP